MGVILGSKKIHECLENRATLVRKITVEWSEFVCAKAWLKSCGKERSIFFLISFSTTIFVDSPIPRIKSGNWGAAAAGRRGRMLRVLLGPAPGLRSRGLPSRPPIRGGGGPAYFRRGEKLLATPTPDCPLSNLFIEMGGLWTEGC